MYFSIDICPVSGFRESKSRPETTAAIFMGTRRPRPEAGGQRRGEPAIFCGESISRSGWAAVIRLCLSSIGLLLFILFVKYQ